MCIRDRYGNECTQGGCIITGKYQGANMPPGQDPNVEVVDGKDGTYTFKLWMKAGADVNVCDYAGRSALDCAKRCGYYEVERVFKGV